MNEGISGQEVCSDSPETVTRLRVGEAKSGNERLNRDRDHRRQREREKCSRSMLADLSDFKGGRTVFSTYPSQPETTRNERCHLSQAIF